MQTRKVPIHSPECVNASFCKPFIEVPLMRGTLTPALRKVDFNYFNKMKNISRTDLAPVA